MRDNNWNSGLVLPIGWDVFDLSDDQHSVFNYLKRNYTQKLQLEAHFSEDDVFIVEKIAFCAREEELTAVCVLSRVR